MLTSRTDFSFFLSYLLWAQSVIKQFICGHAPTTLPSSSSASAFNFFLIAYAIL
jgi:hypothetical protein